MRTSLGDQGSQVRVLSPRFAADCTAVQPFSRNCSRFQVVGISHFAGTSHHSLIDVLCCKTTLSRAPSADDIRGDRDCEQREMGKRVGYPAREDKAKRHRSTPCVLHRMHAQLAGPVLPFDVAGAPGNRHRRARVPRSAALIRCARCGAERLIPLSFTPLGGIIDTRGDGRSSRGEPSSSASVAEAASSLETPYGRRVVHSGVRHSEARTESVHPSLGEFCARARGSELGPACLRDCLMLFVFDRAHRPVDRSLLARPNTELRDFRSSPLSPSIPSCAGVDRRSRIATRRHARHGIDALDWLSIVRATPACGWQHERT